MKLLQLNDGKTKYINPLLFSRNEKFGTFEMFLEVLLDQPQVFPVFQDEISNIRKRTERDRTEHQKVPHS